MLSFSIPTRTVVTSIEVDEQRVQVAVDVSHDGIEYLGRLWFTTDATPAEDGIPDRGVLPGRTEADVVTLARKLRPDELLPRYRRAQAEKRRFLGLRQITGEILAKIRYLNQVAVSVRSGLLDREAGTQELDLTEQQIVELVKQAKRLAGIES